MNDHIIIYYSPFTQVSSVYIVDKNGAKNRYEVDSQFSMLAEMVADIAYTHDITSIKISAPLAIYGEMETLIQKFAKNQYSMDNLEIEVI